MKKVLVVIVLVDMNESFNFWTLDNDIKMSKPPKFYLHHHISRVCVNTNLLVLIFHLILVKEDETLMYTTIICRTNILLTNNVGT